jgi:hypothetical protein
MVELSSTSSSLDIYLTSLVLSPTLFDLCLSSFLIILGVNHLNWVDLHRTMMSTLHMHTEKVEALVEGESLKGLSHFIMEATTSS